MCADVGLQPLLIAAEAGRTEVVKFLIDSGAAVNARNISNENSLHLSAKRGHIATTRMLIEKGCSLHEETSTGYTPLMVAVVCGHLPIVKLLCEYGCRPNYVSSVHGDNSMYIAASKGHTEICEYFLKNFPSLYEENKTMMLWIVALWDKLWQGPQQKFLHIIQLIIRPIIKTVLHICYPYQSDRNKKEESVIENWKPAVHAAAANGYLDIVKLLVNHNASLVYFLESEYAHIPYHTAAMTGQINILKYFLYDHHVPVNIKNGAGNSALHLAARCGCPNTVSFLIDEGASISIRNNNGSSVLHYGCASTSVETIKLLIEKGIPIDVTDDVGSQPLHTAAQEGPGKTEIMNFLIENGAEINAKDNDGLSVLDYCIAIEDLETVKMLIEKGCSLQVENSFGYTPLMMAVCVGNLSIVKLLCENGCRPDEVSNVHSKNCIDFASSKGHTKICEYFLKELPTQNLQQL